MKDNFIFIFKENKTLLFLFCFVCCCCCVVVVQYVGDQSYSNREEDVGEM